MSLIGDTLAAGRQPFLYLYDISSVLNPMLVAQQFIYGGTLIRHDFQGGLFFASGDGSWFSAFAYDEGFDFTNIGTYLFTEGDGSFFIHDSLVVLAAGLAGLRALVLDTTVASIKQGNGVVPLGPALFTSYPNPFNGQTLITYEINHQMRVDLEVFNMLGQRVANLASGDHSPGRYQVFFKGTGVASGVYFARLRTRTWQRVIEMILQK
jgi:hypothetical protein